MKRIFLAISLLVVAINMLNAQNPVIKKGSKLTYHVTTGDKEYDYVVTVKNFGTSISFDWMMTEPVNTSGKINITAAALETAVSYKNYFGDGSNETLTKQSTVWLSRKNFNELKSMAKTKIDMTGETGVYEKNAKPQQVSYDVKGVTNNATVISCQFIKTADTKYTVRVFDDAKDPLIQYMDLGSFTITLKRIE
jgi:hypothetical protein